MSKSQLLARAFRKAALETKKVPCLPCRNFDCKKLAITVSIYEYPNRILDKFDQKGWDTNDNQPMLIVISLQDFNHLLPSCFAVSELELFSDQVVRCLYLSLAVGAKSLHMFPLKLWYRQVATLWKPGYTLQVTHYMTYQLVA